MAAEADASTIEDKYVTNCYYVMKKFKYSFKEILEMPISLFDILLDEMIKESKREKAEINKANKKK